jgi:hypothetical protein
VKASLFFVLGALVGCATPDASAVVTPTTPPESSFPFVAQLMEHRCGSLDCHGSVARNLRIYGNEGLRYAPDASASPCVPRETTGAEIHQDFESVVGLEPESMSAVVANHGADPQSLTLIGKPLGLQAHQGGTVFHVGDDSYECMTSWIAGATDTAACLAALPAQMCGIPSRRTVDASAD